MADGQGVALTVNGAGVLVDAPAGYPLIAALRERLGLRGVRAGCAVGECGACTVLVDGTPTKSCVTPLDTVAGATITTPEGLGGPDDPGPIQRAFLDLQAAQCGYCVNGIIMSVAAMAADENAERSVEGVRRALAGNLCRCGTHLRLLQAACEAVGVPGETRGVANVDRVVGDALGTCEVVRRPLPEPLHTVTSLPSLVEESPRVEQWLELTGDGRVQILSGRSELGQGVHVAQRQVVAAQLGIGVELVDVHAPSTAVSPDEGYTAGSQSMQTGGVVLAMAAAGLRRLLLDRVSGLLGAAADELTVRRDGAVAGPDGRQVTFAEVARAGGIGGAIELSDQPRWDVAPLGESPRRPDLRFKLTGSAGYIHDLVFDDMLYARALMPPTYDALLDDLDLDDVRERPEVVEVVRDGRLLLVIATSDHEAARAVATLEARARWSGAHIDVAADPLQTLRALPRVPFVAHQDDDVDAALDAGKRFQATYGKAYQVHGAMAPSCAIGLSGDDGLTVWSHTQGVHPLRAELATLCGEDPARVTVVHVDGPGCYGQNGADDAAGFAALAARAVPGRHVRFQFSSSDEFGWEPYSTAMAADVEASLDVDGRILAWRSRTLTDAHTVRPRGQGDRLAASWLREDGVERAWGGASAGGARNSVPIYTISALDAVADHFRGPLRSGSTRTLGAFFNVFVVESFMDELAEEAGADPLAFRLTHLDEPRARDVLALAADRAGWQPRVGPSGRGQGLAVCRYDGTKGYAAVVADVDVDLDAEHIAVRRVVLCTDAGTVVNAEGLRQQLEGGVVQGISRTLHEALRVDSRGVHSRDWSTYPVVRFADIPRMDVILLDRPGSRPLGAGEVSTPPVPAAIANAIDDAVGIRMRDLPITPASMRERVLEMTEPEMARVLLA